MSGANDALLEVRGLTKQFGGLTAVSGVDFDVRRGMVAAIVGPNGAGKTTLFHMLSGIERPTSGSISLDGRQIQGKRPHQVCRAGIGRTFQLTEIYPQLTVAENVMVGLHTQSRSGFLSCGLRLPGVRKEERRLRHDAERLLEWVHLADLAETRAGDLPFGHQRLIELARAVATKPQLLLCDEPASGLDVGETDRLAELVQDVRADGVTVLLIEHDMRFVMSLADHIVAIDHGSKIDEGAPDYIRQSPAVLEAYLGGST